MTLTITTGSSGKTYDASADFRVSQASDLCKKALETSPDGNIPVQTVYEMLLTIIGREDVIEDMRRDGDISDIEVP